MKQANLSIRKIDTADGTSLFVNLQLFSLCKTLKQNTLLLHATREFSKYFGELEGHSCQEKPGKNTVNNLQSPVLLIAITYGGTIERAACSAVNSHGTKDSIPNTMRDVISGFWKYSSG